MTEEEKVERDAKRRVTLERTARQYERLMGPTRDAIAAMGGFDAIHAAVPATDGAMAAMCAIEDAVSSPAMQLARDWAASPLERTTRELANGAMAQLARDSHSSVLLGAVDGLRMNLQPMCCQNISMPELAGTDRLRELARDPQVETGPGLVPMSSELLRPLRPPRDVDQDERFEHLSTAVVAQTGELIELRREVREVKDSASRDSHRGRVQAMRQDRAGARLQWWHLALSAVLGAALQPLIELMWG